MAMRTARIEHLARPFANKSDQDQSWRVHDPCDRLEHRPAFRYRYDFLTGSRRRGSQCLGSLARWLRAEVDAYMAQFADEPSENGRRLVVRNGSHQSREGLTSGISRLQDLTFITGAGSARP